MFGKTKLRENYVQGPMLLDAPSTAINAVKNRPKQTTATPAEVMPGLSMLSSAVQQLHEHVPPEQLDRIDPVGRLRQVTRRREPTGRTCLLPVGN